MIEQEREPLDPAVIEGSEFYPDWYQLGIRSQETGESGEPIGNRAYLDWMERILTAAGRREVDWLQVSLAVALDRMVRKDEARIAALAAERAEEPREVEAVDLVAALRASVEAAKKRREETCALCELPRSVDVHHDESAKGHHPFEAAR